jgi:hypothetical protein
LSHSYGRDVTTLIYTYHRNPSNCAKVLAKYETDLKVKDVMNKNYNVPDFIIPPTFDAERDIMVFDFKNPDGMFEKVKKAVYTPEH